MITRITIFIVVLLICRHADGCCDPDSVETVARKGRRPFPHILSVQYAGNIGFISAGAGLISKKNNYQLTFLYGYSPASVSGTRIHSLTARNVFHFRPFGLRYPGMITPYGGVAVNMEIGGRSFLFLPDNMPDSYYDFPKSLHLIASAGLKKRVPTKMKAFRVWEVFAEASTTDFLIWYKIISDEVRFHHMVSGSLGVNFLRR